MAKQDPRFSYTTRQVPQAEKDAVAVCRAKWDAAKRVWDRRKARTQRLREMLAGKNMGSSWSSGAVAATSQTAPGYTTGSDVASSNLFLIAQTALKAEAADDDWGARYPSGGDIPDTLVDEMELFYEKVAIESNVTAEFSDAIDDGGTIGVMVIWYGIDRQEKPIDRSKMAGSAVPIDELVNAAASGADVHPLPGMDFLALANAATAFANDPEQGIVRTLGELDNLKRLADEADAMWADEMEKAPGDYAYGAIRTRRLVYGEDILWDPRVTTRWQDARWVGRRLVLAPSEARDMASFKPSARKELKGGPIDKEAGWVEMSGAELSEASNEELNKCVCCVEFWDRDTGEVHYFSESGGYDGFLERDSRYPYNGADGRSVLKDWFPMRAVTPVQHNLREPERTLGIPWLEPGLTDAIRYNLFDAALTASRRKAGRIIEYPPDANNEVKNALESGSDLVLVERPAEMQESKPLVVVHEFGKAPVDWLEGKEDALRSFARKVNMTVEEVSGQSPFGTLGQAEMAARGARGTRGGLVRRLQTFAGEILGDLGALARRFYTDARVTQLMGLEFTTRRPLTDETGMPVVDPNTGEAVNLPSIWDLFKGSSLAGDKIEAVFSPSGQGEDPIKAKSEADFVALLASPAGINPATGMPYFDNRHLLERMAKHMGFGRLKEFTPPMLPPGAPPPPQAQGEQAPANGQRQDGRQARGERGPGPVPGRQTRGRRPGDVGDISTEVNRTGVA